MEDGKKEIELFFGKRIKVFLLSGKVLTGMIQTYNKERFVIKTIFDELISIRLVDVSSMRTDGGGENDSNKKSIN